MYLIDNKRLMARRAALFEMRRAEGDGEESSFVMGKKSSADVEPWRLPRNCQRTGAAGCWAQGDQGH